MTINDIYSTGYPEYFAPLPDIGMALERIGLDPKGDYSPSKENLQKIMLAHMTTVPYETLDCCDYKRYVDFAPEHLFEKFVLNRRGGYCYEINGFFMAVIQALGYDCFPLSGRLLFGQPVYNPMGHRTTVVNIGDKRYLCDVGYGAGCAEGPVDIDDPDVQDILGYHFSIRHHEGAQFGDITLVKHAPDGTQSDFYTVYLQPHTVLEFLASNERTQKSDRRVVRLRTATGSIAVDGNIFRRKVNGEVFEEEITSYPHLYKILTEEFNMIVPRMSFSKTWPRELAWGDRL
ncbi:MAG: arylamine N-acetyltransferase [Peptococcaceae bacterium]|jgi:N-hydroxyarylamine O-acetyltransferase|nr:arylamine N-acetyltransferase [Peptococcaceae bacterium]